MLVMIDENGVADVYDDTYDIVIHCENEEDQKDARLALKNVRRWIPVTEKLPEPETYILRFIELMMTAAEHFTRVMRIIRIFLWDFM